MKKYEEIEKEVEDANLVLKGKHRAYASRTKLGFCKNKGCNNARRHGSAYCGQCNK